jgi:hypothetical protein
MQSLSHHALSYLACPAASRDLVRRIKAQRVAKAAEALAARTSSMDAPVTESRMDLLAGLRNLSRGGGARLAICLGCCITLTLTPACCPLTARTWHAPAVIASCSQLAPSNLPVINTPVSPPHARLQAPGERAPALPPAGSSMNNSMSKAERRMSHISRINSIASTTINQANQDTMMEGMLNFRWVGGWLWGRGRGRDDVGGVHGCHSLMESMLNFRWVGGECGAPGGGGGGRLRGIMPPLLEGWCNACATWI